MAQASRLCSPEQARRLFHFQTLPVPLAEQGDSALYDGAAGRLARHAADYFDYDSPAPGIAVITVPPAEEVLVFRPGSPMFNS